MFEDALGEQVVLRELPATDKNKGMVMRWLRNAKGRSAGSHNKKSYGKLLRYCEENFVDHENFIEIIRDKSR